MLRQDARKYQRSRARWRRKTNRRDLRFIPRDPVQIVGAVFSFFLAIVHTRILSHVFFVAFLGYLISEARPSDILEAYFLQVSCRVRIVQVLHFSRKRCYFESMVSYHSRLSFIVRFLAFKSYTLWIPLWSQSERLSSLCKVEIVLGDH